MGCAHQDMAGDVEVRVWEVGPRRPRSRLARIEHPCSDLILQVPARHSAASVLTVGLGKCICFAGDAMRQVLDCFSDVQAHSQDQVVRCTECHIGRCRHEGAPYASAGQRLAIDAVEVGVVLDQDGLLRSAALAVKSRQAALSASLDLLCCRFAPCRHCYKMLKGNTNNVSQLRHGLDDKFQA